MLGILVERLLAGPHAVLPLKKLRYRGVERIAHQQHYLLAIEIGFAVAVSGVVLDVVVVGEEQLGDCRVLAVQVVEADQVTGGQSVFELVEA